MLYLEEEIIVTEISYCQRRAIPLALLMVRIPKILWSFNLLLIWIIYLFIALVSDRKHIFG